MNRLSGSTSPYLLQHKDNPVAWWPWCDEAFDEARRRDVPVFLSVGYAACHWCHVMAHDSFERDDVAAVLNEHYVSIKVDREERPDVDAVYMEATVALTGQGGWPMTCLLTADGAPFFGGTFFPRAQFLQLLSEIARLWQQDRERVLAAGQQVLAGLASVQPPSTAGPVPSAEHLDAAAAALAPQFDAARGGFGGAPKFPPSMVLEFLMRHAERTGDPSSLAMAERTLDAMARGGMYDQLAGGFARYSVDAGWVVPHFEKMLYDNALLLRAYLHWWRRTDSPLAERIARDTAEFLLRDLRTDEGGFASALDADTEGAEGLTYVWTPAQLRDVLGEDAEAAAQLFGVTEAGTFEHGASTLQLREDPSDVEQWQRWRAAMLAVRNGRPQPARDDKVVTAWNGLAIAALAEASALLDEPRYLDAARAAAELITRVHVVTGRLRRTSRHGVASDALAVAEDYGDLADGLLVLHQVTSDPHWLEHACGLLDFALEHFADGDGSFFDTGDDAAALVRRPKDVTDNAAPSGASALASALLTASALTGELRYREAAESALRIVSDLGARQPRFFGWALAAAEGLVSGPIQVAVSGEGPDGPLARLVWRQRPPGAVVVVGLPDTPGVPLLAARPLVGGAPAAYVCRGMVCDRPVTTVAELQEALARTA